MNTTIEKNVVASGHMARLSDRDSRSFHSFDADRISDALNSIIRLITAAMLISAIPTLVNIVIAEVVLIAGVVLIIDDSIYSPKVA